MIDELLADVGLKVGGLEKSQKELVDDLEVGPARLVRGLVLLLVGVGGALVANGRQRAKYVKGDHGGHFRIDGLGQAALGHADVVDELVEARSLDLLALEVGDRVDEVEDDAALLELLDEELLLLAGRRVLDGRQRLELLYGRADEARRDLLASIAARATQLPLLERVYVTNDAGGGGRVRCGHRRRRRRQRRRGQRRRRRVIEQRVGREQRCGQRRRRLSGNSPSSADACSRRSRWRRVGGRRLNYRRRI